MAHAPAAQAPRFVTFSNFLAKRALKLGPLMGPNALITVRGRKSGQPRTTPVAVVEIDGRRWVVGTFGEVNWVRNLRVAGQAILSVGSRNDAVTARELTVDERTRFFRDVLTPYVKHLRVGTLLLAMLGARDIVEDPSGAAVKRPVFELTAA